MKVGFTGSQKGMTTHQIIELTNQLIGVDANEFHHGDCIGADSTAHAVAALLYIPITIHPPLNETKRAFNKLNEKLGELTVLPAKEYLDRNHDIVDATDMLIATPSGPEKLRSGTCATVRYARKQGKKVVIIEPDGTVNDG